MENKSTVGEQSSKYGFLPFPPFGRDVMLLILAWVAGSVDAISYLGLGHVFTANMTGNTVLLGLALGQREGLAILRSLTALGGFVVGLAVGAVIVDRDRRREDWPPVVTGAIMLEGCVLAVFAVIWYLGGIARGRELV